MDDAIKDKILVFLRTVESASASDIGKAINHNRITVGKYLQILEAQGVVSSQKIASALYWKVLHQKPKILIVDDEEHIVDLIRLSLGDAYEIHTAYNGVEALRVAHAVHPDVIILDIMMPQKDGFEVCKELKQHKVTGDIAIIFLSAKNQTQDKVKAINMGGDDYIVKPFDPLELEARVASIIRRNELQHSKNSITGLPNSIFTQDMKQEWMQKKGWCEYIIEVLHLEKYLQQVGHKKGYETMRIIARMFSDILEEGDFLGHSSNETLVLFTHTPIDIKKIQHTFDNMRPYFYGDHTSADLISLHIEEHNHV